MSSQLDVDRLDYLLRDGHYSGAGYATYDLDWIIHAIQIAEVRSGAEDPTDLVVEYRRGMYAVGQYLFARSYMYAQVYHHKTVRAAQWMFIKTLERFAELAAVLEQLEPGLPETLRTFWGKGYKPHFARKLVSSQLDVDRLDYLLSDGHYSGAGYATYDLDWILHALAVEDVRVGADDPRPLDSEGRSARRSATTPPGRRKSSG